MSTPPSILPTTPTYLDGESFGRLFVREFPTGNARILCWITENDCTFWLHDDGYSFARRLSPEEEQGYIDNWSESVANRYWREFAVDSETYAQYQYLDYMDWYEDGVRHYYMRGNREVEVDYETGKPLSDDSMDDEDYSCCDTESVESDEDVDTQEYPNLVEGQNRQWVDRLLNAVELSDTTVAVERNFDTPAGLEAMNRHLDEELRLMGVDPTTCRRTFCIQDDDVIVAEEEFDCVCYRKYFQWQERGCILMALHVIRLGSQHGTTTRVSVPVLRLPTKSSQ